MNLDAPILELCRRLGVETDYVDNAGVRREPPRATLVALLAALGYPAATRSEAEASIDRFRQRTVARPVEPVVVCRDDTRPASVLVTLPASTGNRRLQWEIEAESGSRAHGETGFTDLPLMVSVIAGGRTYERRRLAMPTPLPLGYHRAKVRVADAAADGALIVGPRQAYRPPVLDGG